MHVTRTQSDYKQKCEELFSEYEELKSHEIELEIMLHERSGRGEKLGIFTDLFMQFDGSHIEFSQDFWGTLVEQAVVALDVKVTFRLLGGFEATV